MRRFLSLFALVGLAMSPAFAQQKPLVSMGGQTRQLPAGTTLGVNPGTTGAASINIPQGVAPTSPANGDCWTTTAGLTCRINGVSITGIAQAPTNSALAALPSSLGRVARNGYYSEGDAPPLLYTASGSACSLNAGAGDGGSQIPSSDGKCWVASAFGSAIDARQFGAQCNGSADDTTKFSAIVVYAGTKAPAKVSIPGGGLCVISSTITVPSGVSFQGQGTSFGGGVNGSGFITNTPSLNPMFSMSGIGNSFSDMFFGGTSGGTGFMLRWTDVASGQGVVENVFMFNVCGAVAFNGYQHRITKTYIANPGGASCDVISIGDSTTGANTTGTLIDHVSVYALSPVGGSAPRSCFHIADAGGVFITHSDAVKCFIGTWIAPSAVNQEVTWLTVNDSYLADNSTGDGVVINTSFASNTIRGLSFNNAWSSSNVGGGVVIKNDGGGSVAGLYWDQLRAFTNGAHGFSIAASTPTQIYLTDSHICSYGASSSGFNAVSGASDFLIGDTEIRRDCAGRPASGGTGVTLVGTNANITLSNLDLRGNGTEVSGIPTGDSFVSNIRAVSYNGLPVASATSISIAAVYPNWSLTGSTAVQTITGAWSGRVAYITPTAANIQFNTGGNICNALLSTQNVPVIATYVGSCWRLK